MPKTTLAEQIQKEQTTLQKTRARIDQLKEKEAKRILRIAEKTGYFEVEITDQSLESAFEQLVNSAKNADLRPDGIR